MADPAAVKRALHALAYGEHTEQTAREVAHRLVIVDASESVAAVDDAAMFCERHGLDSLRRAIRTAAARDDHDLAARGRETLVTLRDYQRAAAGDDVNKKTVVGDGTETTSTEDHFHSGRGTTLPGAGQRGDR